MSTLLSKALLDLETNHRIVGEVMKKKVLFVVDERMMGGVSVVLNDLLHLLDERLFELDVLVLHDRGDMLQQLPEHVHMFYGTPYFQAIDYTMKEVIKKHRISLLYHKLRVVMDLKTGHIKKQIKKERNRCLHKTYDVEVAFKDGFTALFTAYGDSKKKIHWLHCAYRTFNPNEKYEALFQETLPRFDAIIGVAPNVVKEFNELYHLEEKSEAIAVAMDVKRIKQEAEKEAALVLQPQHLQLFLVGRAHPVKGYERLFRVLQQLHLEHLLEDVDVHVIGDGPLLEQLQNQVKEAKLEHYVFFEGRINNPYAELKHADVLLLPSYSEAFGTVISEAFILGVPVLSTRTSASELSIQDGVNGWVCENEEDALYDAIKSMLLHRETIKQYKQNLVGYEYDNTTILKRIHEIMNT